MEFVAVLKSIQQSIPEEYAQTAAVIGMVLPYFVIAMQLLTCFLGYRLHLFWVRCVAFVIGFLLGAGVGFFFPSCPVLWPFILLGLVLGTGGALIAKRLRDLFLFFFNGFLAYWAVGALIPEQVPGWIAILAGLAVGIAAGFLVIKFRFFVTMVTTACSGGIASANLIFALFAINSKWVTLPVGVLLACGGVGVQFFVEKNHIKKIKDKAVLLAPHSLAPRKEKEQQVAEYEEKV